MLLESAGRACSDRDAGATASLELVAELWTHGEPSVRRRCAFLLSRVRLVGPHALVRRPKTMSVYRVALRQLGDSGLAFLPPTPSRRGKLMLLEIATLEKEE